MLLPWTKKQRRKKLLSTPFPDPLRLAVERDAAFYRGLAPRERSKLEEDLRILTAETSWEACGGLTLTAAMKAVIAAQACLLVLNRSIDEFSNVRSVLVYPEAYIAPTRKLDRLGMVMEGEQARSGEAWSRGTVVLSWADAEQGGRFGSDGRNLVLHEFAHQLDMADRVVDGTPILDRKEDYVRWKFIMTAEFQRLRSLVESGGETVLDPYGATDEAEFFAVATEFFFERPTLMRTRRPALYDLLLGYYRQDPAERERAAP